MGQIETHALQQANITRSLRRLALAATAASEAERLRLRKVDDAIQSRGRRARDIGDRSAERRKVEHLDFAVIKTDIGARSVLRDRNA